MNSSSKELERIYNAFPKAFINQCNEMKFDNDRTFSYQRLYKFW